LAPADINRLLAPYHVARGGLMKDVLALPDDWGRSAREAQPHYVMEKEMGRLWHGDEEYSTAKVKSYRKQSVFRLLVRQKSYPAHDSLWNWHWRQWAAAARRINPGCQWMHDPPRLKRGYYLDVQLWLPSPEHMARADLLIKGESCSLTDEVVDKWSKHLLVASIAASDYVRHGVFLSEAKSAFRLLALYIQKNRAPRDAAWTRYMRERVAQIVRDRARSLPAFFRR